MFTAGLKLLTCAAELSGPTCLSLSKDVRVGGGWRWTLSPAWLLLFVEKVFLLGRRGGGGARSSCFVPWSRLSKREAFAPTPCLLTCQETIQAIKPREIRSRTGTGGLGCSRLSSHPSGTCFLEHHMPGSREGAGMLRPPSPFSSAIQITNRGPRRAPSSKLPGFLFLEGGRTGERNMKFGGLLAMAGAACTVQSWLRFPQHLLLLLNVIQRIQLGHRGLGFQKQHCLSSPPPPREAGASGKLGSWVSESPAFHFLGRGQASTPLVPSEAILPFPQRPGGRAGCSSEPKTKPEPSGSPLISVAPCSPAVPRCPYSPCRSPSLEKGFYYTSESVSSGLKPDPDGLSCIWAVFFVGPKVADLRKEGVLSGAVTNKNRDI